MWMGCASVTVKRVVAVDPVVVRGLAPTSWDTLGKRWPTQEELQDLLDDPATQADPQKLLASAEAAYHTAHSARRNGADPAIRWFLLSARQAFTLLSEFDLSEEESRRTQTLYNSAVAHCLRLALLSEKIDSQRQLNLGPLQEPLPIRFVGFTRDADEFGRIELCEDLQIQGLDPVHKVDGLGVPLVVHALSSKRIPAEQRPAYEISFPVTATIHFDGPCHLPTRLEFTNPLSIDKTQFEGRRLQLASDLTTPLAQTVSQTEFDRLAYLGFLRGQAAKERSGVKMLDPYHPGKIPVVFVHGLASSPITWAPMFNDLLSDPELRKRFQYWVHFYPTGDPFPTSAADFRETLAKLRHDLDPEGKDPALDHWVLLGHSMGGLICKMVTVEGGDEFWPIVSRIPFDEVELSPKVRKELRRTFYFDRLPFVKRVVFIATPHHGSQLSPSPLGRLAAKLVRLRDDLTEASKEMVRNIPDLPGGHVPTSVELLAPDSLALKILANREVSNEVQYHSIVGVIPAPEKSLSRYLLPMRPFRLHAWIKESTDGVVTYQSAHIEQVQSESIVAAEHMTIQKNPETTKEVRRILMEHWAALESQVPGAAARIIDYHDRCIKIAMPVQPSQEKKHLIRFEDRPLEFPGTGRQ